MPGSNQATRWRERADAREDAAAIEPAPRLRGQTLKALGWIFGRTFGNWFQDKAPRLGAALSYYTVFSLAPTLVIVISIAGTVFGKAAVQGRVFDEISRAMGPNAAGAVQHLLTSVYHSGSGLVASIVSAVTLLIAATGVFVELQDALNTIWRVELAGRSSIRVAIRDRITSFLILLGIGFLLLVSLIASAVLTKVVNFVNGPSVLLHVADLGFSFAVTTLLFALVYKLVPDIEIAWRDAVIGGAVTALLFSLGKLLIGLYLGRLQVTSTYGGTGAVMLVLAWVYYSAQIIIFGAEFTRVYANHYGSRSRPAEGARFREECPE